MSRKAADTDRCTATTGKKRRCKRKKLPGLEVCSVHAGAKVGRPTKLDSTVTDRICEFLRAGGYIESAVAAAGVSRATFHAWIERGDPAGRKPADAPYRAFRERIEQVRAEGEARNVALIARAAASDWKAAAWMLERQFPGRWGGPRGRSTAIDVPRIDQPKGHDDGDGPGWVDNQVGPDGKPL